MTASGIISVSAIVLVSLGLLFGLVSPNLAKSLIDSFISLFSGPVKQSEKTPDSSEAGTPSPSSEESSSESLEPSKASEISLPPL